MQLWWLPLGVEDGEGRWESHKYIVSKVVKEHPEWLILDKEGQARTHHAQSRGAVPRRSGGAAILQTAHGEVYSRLGIRRLQARQYLHRPHVLQPGASSQVAAGFSKRDRGRLQDIYQTTRAIKPGHTSSPSN